MSDYAIRTLDGDDVVEANTLFRAALHSRPSEAEHRAEVRAGYPAGRALGVLDGDDLVGTAMSFPSALAVPGGAVRSMAAVSRIAVRADHTRRGVLTMLQKHQLADLAGRGEVFASLRASEASIYGRFGYGVAERIRSITVRSAIARIRPTVPRVGHTRLVDQTRIDSLLPALYERIGLHRAGMITRPDELWRARFLGWRTSSDLIRTAVHSDADGTDDGFVVYRTAKDGSGFTSFLEVIDLHGATPTATRELWRFLLSIDLIDSIKVMMQAVDDPLEWLLTDRRAVEVTGVEDATWLRILDVPTALAARTYAGGDAVVIEVEDPQLPANSGRYRIDGEGAHRTEEPADLVMSVAVLGALYLGDVAPSALACSGWLTATDETVLARADRLFRTTIPPYCGTFF
ncbi:GNAT family N-acetyltransferase [Actinoalloteichus hymeniacidonis]|uniref:GNAT family N-acetyltransferase n=1 Tax=Actinoalloteichus hymeniacidonis TaxID=340345 RepID=UPI000852C631|nr:GNAT family N-acetyltransferase [Actinoalloteichus hymeniacidonis]MBB5908722.1 putative acetyltransferase [Actinoalloteichus hymeniacidonis]